jgi:hypothetical protein
MNTNQRFFTLDSSKQDDLDKILIMLKDFHESLNENNEIAGKKFNNTLTEMIKLRSVIEKNECEFTPLFLEKSIGISEAYSDLLITMSNYHTINAKIIRIYNTILAEYRNMFS